MKSVEVSAFKVRLCNDAANYNKPSTLWVNLIDTLHLYLTIVLDYKNEILTLADVKRKKFLDSWNIISNNLLRLKQGLKTFL